MVRTPPVIDVVELFPELHRKLIELLTRLDPEEWRSPTVCSLWCVQDIAAHLLDTDLRRLSFIRDQHPAPEPARPIAGYRDLVAHLDQLNADWVQAMKRVSPRVLIALLEWSGENLYKYFKTLDLQAPAPWPVAWAGEDASPNWFDIAREYTEKWLHQQQIREAVGRPGITGRELYHPVLDTFLRGLPFAYRDLERPAGTTVAVEVAGEAGGKWFLIRTDQEWQLFLAAEPPADARVVLPQDLAWKIFSKGVDRETAAAACRFAGDRDLARQALALVAVMA